MRTIFESHPKDGVSAIAISHDTKYLATISAGAVQVKKVSPHRTRELLGLGENFGMIKSTTHLELESCHCC